MAGVQLDLLDELARVYARAAVDALIIAETTASRPQVPAASDGASAVEAGLESRPEVAIRPGVT